MKFWFWFLWVIDAVIAAVALYFFFSLSAGGNVGSFNLLPWLIDPCRFGSCGRRQRLVALRRPARSGDHSSAAARNPRSSLRAVLASHLDSPALLSLIRVSPRIIQNQADPLQRGRILFDGHRPPLQCIREG